MGRSTKVLGNIKLPPPLNFDDVVDDDAGHDDDGDDDDDDDDVDKMKEKSSSICPTGRHGESHKTLALRSQNALSRAAHPSWPYIYYIIYYVIYNI